MSPSEQISEYAQGWAGLMKFVRQGHSWSGLERNRFFKNDGGGSFYEMSHLAGLDHSEDGRGLAIVDWDQDGKLDLWYRNRNAPRLRFMHNKRETGPSLSIKLQGTHSNRDAIGAVVELLPSTKETRLVRSLRAGDLFLSQSSKRLHFGTANDPGEKTARVLWPGGVIEDFKNLPAQGHILLKQGSGKAQVIPKRTPLTFPTTAKPNALRDTGNAQIILPARIPFPRIVYRTEDNPVTSLSATRTPKLLLLWSSQCPHCQKTLTQLKEHAQEIRTNKLEIIALSVDEITKAKDNSAADLIAKTSFPFSRGFIDQLAASSLAQFQERLFDRTPASTVPLAILLDESNQALAIYRGTFTVQKILSDWQTLRAATPAQLHHLAPPLKGTWFTNPLPPRDVYRMYQPPRPSPSQD